MVFCDGGGEGHFRERFRDADDGFELTNGDGDTGSFVGILFYLMDLATDIDEESISAASSLSRGAHRDFAKRI